MADLRKFIWLFPVIAGIFAIAAFFSPVAFRNTTGGGTIMFWIFALNIDTTDNDVWINDSDLALTGAVLESIFIIAAVALLFLVTLLVKKEKMAKKSGNIMFFISGILIIIAAIGYMIGAVIWREDFYETYTVTFGIVGLFIGGGVAIFSSFSEMLFKQMGLAG